MMSGLKELFEKMQVGAAAAFWQIAMHIIMLSPLAEQLS